MEPQVLSVIDLSFTREVLEDERPVLVYFWADGPSKKLLSSLRKVAEERGGRLKVVEINTVFNSQMPHLSGIEEVPALALFKGGKVAATRTGELTAGALRAFVEAYL